MLFFSALSVTDRLRATVAAGVLLVGAMWGGSAASAQSMSDLAVTDTTASTVTLDWEPYATDGSDIVGYNIYRRAEGGTYRGPIDYVGVQDREDGTQYTDSRLTAGRTYYYKVRGRTLDGGETRASAEIAITPQEADRPQHTYANLKVAVVIYKNANHRNGGDYQTPDRIVDDIKFYFEKARDYYWRNSGMKLNLQFSYYPIDEYKDFGDVGRFESMRVTADHLENDFGVVSTQYDFIFRLTPSIGGYWSFGVKDLEFEQGPSRQMGFAHLQWPMGRIRGFEKYPAEFDDQVSKETNQLIWLFIHEAQHTIDAVYKVNGLRKMGHGDHPEEYVGTNDDYPQLQNTVRFGKRYDFQATMLRTFDPGSFESFLELRGDWGDILRTEDADQDGMPDHEATVPFDEARFGSDPRSVDTDGDGASDQAEATDGIYPYSVGDPTHPDTDGDGRPDGEDAHMRYDTRPTILRAGGMRPTVDGALGEWSEKTRVSRGVSYKTPNVDGFSPVVHATHTRDSLYVALDVPKSAVPLLRFDLDGDGRWFGAGNTEVRVDVADEGLEAIRTFDASARARQFEQNVLNPNREVRSPNGVWDTNRKYKNEYGRVFSRSDVRAAVRSGNGRVRVEVAVPERPDRAITFDGEDKVGMRIDYSTVGGADAHATTFDKWSYVYYSLGTEKVAPGGEDVATRLSGNSPNPFRAGTTVRYDIAEKGHAEIAVYDVLGRRVRTLLDREVRPGADQTVTWEGTNGTGQPLASGVYFVRLQTASGRQDVSKVVLVR